MTMKKIDKDELKNLFSLFLDLNIELVNKKTLIANIMKDGSVLLIELLRRELKSNFNPGELLV